MNKGANGVSSATDMATPSTRFQGSKRKLLPWLRKAFDKLEFSTVADVMCGTGTVSYMLKRMGKTVYSNDYLKFNHHSVQAFIENQRYSVSEDDTKWVLGTHSELDYPSFVADTFGGMYFTDVENAWLDRTICNIRGLEGQNGQATQAKRAIAFHALIQACLQKRPFNQFHRKNLYLRTATVERSFGNSTTWERPFSELWLRHVKEGNSFVFNNGQKNIATNKDATKFRKKSVDLVYIDPPYFRFDRERKQCNYRYIYHFAEGLAQYDRWSEMLDWNTPTLPLAPNGNSTEALHSCPQSELRNSILAWLKKIVDNWPDAQIVFSYKHPGVPSSGAIKKMLEESGRDVSLYRKPYTYALNHRNGKPNENLELLFVAR